MLAGLCSYRAVHGDVNAIPIPVPLIGRWWPEVMAHLGGHGLWPVVCHHRGTRITRGKLMPRRHSYQRARPPCPPDCRTRRSSRPARFSAAAVASGPGSAARKQWPQDRQRAHAPVATPNGLRTSPSGGPGRSVPARVFRHACKLGLEGIVSKRFGSPYRSGPLQSFSAAREAARGPLPPRACATPCPQLAKADAAFPAHPLANPQKLA
jgi:hypothetical protein